MVRTSLALLAVLSAAQLASIVQDLRPTMKPPISPPAPFS